MFFGQGASGQLLLDAELSVDNERELVREFLELSVRILFPLLLLRINEFPHLGFSGFVVVISQLLQSIVDTSVRSNNVLNEKIVHHIRVISFQRYPIWTNQDL